MYNRRFKSILLSGLTVSALGAGAAHAAPASGTAAGTQINNTASVTFTVNGNAGSANSNQSSFLVDKKVNLTVAEVGGQATQTSLGATDQVTTFTVTNNTNATQDFRLVVDQQNLSIPIIGVDNFDVNNERVFVDSNGNGRYDPGTDTKTYIDELAPDASVTVFIVADIPNQQGANFAIVSLTAIAAEGGTQNALGPDLVATSLLQADDPTKVDIVFADGTSFGDGARNGQNRAGDAYQISGTTLTVDKSATLISDPVDALVNPKAIPGAVVQYCMRITNAGPANANAVNVTDTIPDNMTYKAGSLVVGTAGLGGVNCILLGTPEDDDATGGDETDLYGGSFDGTTVRATIPQVTTLVPMAVSFQAIVN